MDLHKQVGAPKGREWVRILLFKKISNGPCWQSEPTHALLSVVMLRFITAASHYPICLGSRAGSGNQQLGFSIVCNDGRGRKVAERIAKMPCGGEKYWLPFAAGLQLMYWIGATRFGTSMQVH